MSKHTDPPRKVVCPKCQYEFWLDAGISTLDQPMSWCSIEDHKLIIPAEWKAMDNTASVTPDGGEPWG